jgi:aspartyl-tRNA(Asn)/glutamyl-tRNA(Gln) amidotransferase subunit B
MGDFFASLNDKNISISDSPVTAKKMSQLIDSISSGVISGRTAKEVFEAMKETGEEPNKIIESKGLQQKSDPKELEEIVEKILADNKDKVDQYKSGKDKLFGFFVGQVMKVSGGKANPQLVNEILKNKLK